MEPLLLETANLKRQNQETGRAKKLVCKVCEKKFKRKYNLIRHIEIQHNGKLEPDKEKKKLKPIQLNKKRSKYQP